jgi:hypothetical protein
MIVYQEVKNWNSRHRAVAPVIATLLMVAIAVVGGTIIFVFSQGFFNQAQISGTPAIESVKILGYDARDVAALEAHNGISLTAVGSDPANQGKNVGEYVIVYVKNDSVGQLLFSEIRLGGTVYTYDNPGIIPTPFLATNSGQYYVLANETNSIASQAGLAEPGQTIGILFELADNYPTGRDTQFKLSTTNGAVFVGTVVMGQNTG